MSTQRTYWPNATSRSPFDPSVANAPTDSEGRPSRFGTRVAACVLAGLVCLYHGQNALAEVVVGSVSNDEVSVQWEYDLEQGTGQVTILNLAIPLDPTQEWLYLVGLVPTDVAIQYDPATVGINPCTSATIPPLSYLFAMLPIGAQTTITFQFPTDPWQHELVLTESEYGTGFVLSGGGCFAFPRSALHHFVAVRPIETRSVADLDLDGDVDLQDFDIFGQEFTGPQQP